MLIDPEIGLSADAGGDPARFVGRTDLIRHRISAINAPTRIIAVKGKRGSERHPCSVNYISVRKVSAPSRCAPAWGPCSEPALYYPP